MESCQYLFLFWWRERWTVMWWYRKWARPSLVLQRIWESTSLWSVCKGLVSIYSLSWIFTTQIVANHSFWRYLHVLFCADACPAENTTVPSQSSSELDFLLQWPETPVGAVAEVQCPCVGVNLHLVATRECGGNFISGGRWEQPVDAPCNYSDLARELCQLSEVWQ